MIKNPVIAAITAAVIVVGSLGAPASFAMTTGKMSHHHACKAGGTARHVKVHGKWTWSCAKSHHHKAKAKSSGGSMKSMSTKAAKPAKKSY
jgi:hypothetical protein